MNAPTIETPAPDDKRSKHARASLTSVGPTSIERSYGEEVTKLEARAHKPRDLYTEYSTILDNPLGLFESRAASVQRYLAPGPHGGEMGRWFRTKDWERAPEGEKLAKLVATGRDAAIATDPFCNARVDGYLVDRQTGAHLPIPPLQWEGVMYDVELVAEDVNEPAVITIKPVPKKSNASEMSIAGDTALDKAGFDKNAYMREYQRQARAAKLAGLSMADWREQQGLPAVARGRKRRQPEASG